jgi:nucleotide-binding universal stress UspA family protein
MSVMDTEVRASHTAGTFSTVPTAPLVTVVGFDGTAPARQALRSAAALVAGREGRLEVVFVAHVPSSAALAAESEAAMLASFNDTTQQLGAEVREILAGHEQRWTFHRRDGLVAHELAAAAAELQDELGQDATVVIVVGGSAHAYHQVMGSVPVALARQPHFPLLVVPMIEEAAA